MNIKTSKDLNKLLDNFLSLESYDDNINDLLSKADKCCLEGSNDYRTCDYAEYIDAGIDMVFKSQKTDKPIYCVHSDYQKVSDMILYFVNDLDSLKKMFHDLIDKNTQTFEEEQKERDEKTLQAFQDRLDSHLKLKKKKKMSK